MPRWAVLGSFLIMLSPHGILAAACNSDSLGVGVDLATTGGSVDMGKALGETFFAEDTLIESITVWRVASQDSNVYGMHLFITATDTTGRPRSTLMLLDGPTVYHPYGDKVHPIPFQFVFDPPFSLPRKGTYYFAVQADPCDGFFSIYDTAAIGPDLYLGGNLWLNGRSIFNGCSLRDFPTRLTGDLAFSIRFCSPTTATRGITWGGMKVRYR